MTVILLHGNPETPAVWGPLMDAWRGRDVIAPALPGFGCPRPDGFGATAEDYLAWLIDLVESCDDPVHLIGHDWGGILTARLAIVRPDLLASWASDAVGALHPKYVWHDAAQGWQTPVVGEKMMEAMMTPPASERAAILETLGLSPTIAAIVAGPMDATMGECSLVLYRSAAQPAMIEWGRNPERARAARGAFLHATDDPFVGAAIGTKGLAEDMGARTVLLEGRGHWWMLEEPAMAARVLEAWVRNES